MRPKPHGLEPKYAAQFQDESIVAAYGTRPPYPAELMPLILDHAGTPNPHILDLGCGTGELARRLASHTQAVTAIDHSERMIAQARALPGGNAANIAWIVGRVEDAPLTGPFSCALAAESFHWFDWDRLCRRLHHLVAKRALSHGRTPLHQGAQLPAIAPSRSPSRAALKNASTTSR
jgi:2-polyprenyl-3-methyl-5-hydroxy-6-metoxy-1,4-benzoquinol methylase